MKSAIVFLTKGYDSELFKSQQLFYDELNNYFDIYVIYDEYEKCEVDSFCNINFDFNRMNYVTVNDDYCAKKGYKNAQYIPGKTHITKTPISLDKALLFFRKQNIFSIASKYNFVWFIEDDVFIPSAEAMIKLDKKYKKQQQADLVVPNNNLKKDNIKDWHWPEIMNKIKPPYYSSMICAFGASRNLLNEIDAYVKEHKTLFFAEAMFNTIAMQKGLKVIDAKELKSIVWMGEWSESQIYLRQNNLFHPVKDIASHNKIRETISRMNKMNVDVSETLLPDFLL